jgi:hypothetical protein
MKTGETITTSVGELVLDDYCPYEPSCYHYDPGFWAHIPGAEEEDDLSYFVSEEGIVYSNTSEYPDRYDLSVGTVIRLCRECDGPIHGTSLDVHDSCKRAR